MARVVHATDAGDRCMRQMGSGRCGRQMEVRDSWGGRDLGWGGLVETWWRLGGDLCATCVRRSTFIHIHSWGGRDSG